MLPTRRPTRRAWPTLRLALLAASAGLLLTACQGGGTPWGATPRQLPLPELPRLDQVQAQIDAGTTSGTVRLQQRVAQALQADPALAGLALKVTALEGGSVVLQGAVAGASERQRAVATARSVLGVSQVIDRLQAPE